MINDSQDWSRLSTFKEWYLEGRREDPSLKTIVFLRGKRKGYRKKGRELKQPFCQLSIPHSHKITSIFLLLPSKNLGAGMLANVSEPTHCTDRKADAGGGGS